jgi:hypothetical protein
MMARSPSLHPSKLFWSSSSESLGIQSGLNFPSRSRLHRLFFLIFLFKPGNFIRAGFSFFLQKFKILAAFLQFRMMPPWLLLIVHSAAEPHGSHPRFVPAPFIFALGLLSLIDAVFLRLFRNALNQLLPLTFQSLRID